MTNDASVAPRVVDVPTTDAAMHLLTALYVLGIVQGRNRTPGVETWVAQMRVTLIEVLPLSDVAHVHAECEAMRQKFDRAS
jgi:hypothetical protein